VAKGVGPEFKPQYCPPPKKEKESWSWWLTSIIPAQERLRQEDQKFKAILGYIDT
jgi:hypothetical protein